jgi:hypothetical protein
MQDQHTFVEQWEKTKTVGAAVPQAPLTERIRQMPYRFRLGLAGVIIAIALFLLILTFNDDLLPLFLLPMYPLLLGIAMTGGAGIGGIIFYPLFFLGMPFLYFCCGYLLGLIVDMAPHEKAKDHILWLYGILFIIAVGVITFVFASSQN